MNKLKKKNGFSVVEVVIALAVVIIVSATALVITLYSISTKEGEINKNEAINFTENVLACFKTATAQAEDEEDFYQQLEDLVYFAEGAALEGDDGTYTYSPGIHKYTVGLTAKFTEQGKATLHIYALDRKGNTIVSFDYAIGGRESGE